jgi:hypothetical protein
MYDVVEFSDVESEGRKLENGTGIKHAYRNDTWNREQFTYDPKLQEFVGVSKPSLLWNQFPTMM